MSIRVHWNTLVALRPVHVACTVSTSVSMSMRMMMTIKIEDGYYTIVDDVDDSVDYGGILGTEGAKRQLEALKKMKGRLVAQKSERDNHCKCCGKPCKACGYVG
jgi:hypothetical protein